MAVTIIPNVTNWSVTPQNGQVGYFTLMNTWLSESTVVIASLQKAINAQNAANSEINDLAIQVAGNAIDARNARNEALTAVATLQGGAIDNTTIAPNKAFSNQYTNSNFVKLTGNQTIAGIKTFSSSIAGNITGNSDTATKLATARTINGVNFDGSANITVSDTTAVKLTGDQTIAGTKTFSSNIVGNITGNSGTATKLSTDRTNYKGTTDSVVAGELMWKGYGGNNHTIFDASDSTTPTGVATNNTNPDAPWSATFPTLMGYNGKNTYGVRVDSARVADSTTAFTTAVGSAPSYACRAWVNFNGAGTVYIRASGNVSSITDNGVGDYTVNFTTAMPDANYSINGIVGDGINTSTACNIQMHTSSPYSTAYARFYMNVVNSGAHSLSDMLYTNVSIFR